MADVVGRPGATTLYVVAFPRLAASDIDRLTRLRAENHTVEAAMIGPHLTFMFNLRDVEPESLVPHLAGVAGEAAPIDFVLRRTVLDVEPGAAFACLVPEEGQTEMVELHRRLHLGEGGRWLDPARRFAPHLTIGKSASAAQMRDLLQKLRREEIAMAGRIVDLDLVETDGHRLWRRATVTLGKTA